ncbi:hypothetical protein ABEB36_014567 [Hypothenemus hampei]|uniref:Uncharacterized protein n=1 Tax=Hypothenemus hampei TaxID=57062 RepID=A0ABD1E262_HYPHA
MVKGNYCIMRKCGRNYYDNHNISFFRIPKDFWLEFAGRPDVIEDEQYNKNYSTIRSAGYE